VVELGRARLKEWVAPATLGCIEIISDLHLAAQTPRTFAAWERYMQSTQAGAVFILGDLFESWVGDDSRFSEFEARCADVLVRASARTSLAFMVGNRDFLVGNEMLDACKTQALQDPTVLVAFGERYLLTHGDALCLADTEYQEFRAMVRAPQWQSQLLARPLAQRRALARQLRAGSMERQAGRPHGDACVDIDTPMALRWLDQANAKTLIHGHTHRPGTDSPAPGYSRHVLSDWSFDDGLGARAEVLRLDASGVRRRPLD
jgi:UDP-2,3-diacylglucosamine hydrolase